MPYLIVKVVQPGQIALWSHVHAPTRFVAPCDAVEIAGATGAQEIRPVALVEDELLKGVAGAVLAHCPASRCDCQKRAALRIKR